MEYFKLLFIDSCSYMHVLSFSVMYSRVVGTVLYVAGRLTSSHIQIYMQNCRQNCQICRTVELLGALLPTQYQELDPKIQWAPSKRLNVYLRTAMSLRHMHLANSKLEPEISVTVITHFCRNPFWEKCSCVFPQSV